MFLKVVVSDDYQSTDLVCKKALLKLLAHASNASSSAVVSGRLSGEDMHEVLDELLSRGPVPVQIEITGCVTQA